MSPRAPLWTSTCLFSFVAITACATKSPAGGPAPAQTPSDGLAAAVATIRAEDLASHVETLASDAFAGRFPGTAGEVKTVSYISAHFARVGLRPTVGGSFAQPVPLVSATPDPSATLQAHGARGAATLRWGDDLLVGSPAATPEVTLRDAAVVFAGHGVVAPEYGWDDYGDVDVKGAIVVGLGGDPGPSPQEPTRFEGAALSYYGTSWHKGEAAASRGAAAVLELRADGHGGGDLRSAHGELTEFGHG